MLAGAGNRESGIGNRAAAGYTMVAVVLFMLLLSIVIAAVGPSLGKIGQREREQELLFRGRQYARAIGLFQHRYGRYPNQLKELYENNPRTIRQLFKDPMCNCSDWQVLILNTPEANPQGGFQPPAARTPAFGQAGSPQFSAPPPTPTPGFGSPGNQAVGPIVGVRSKVHKEAISEWRGHKYYDEWRFIVGDADRDSMAFDSNSLRRPPSSTPVPSR